MEQSLTTQIANLLSRAGSAHHNFEQTILKGIYDYEWPSWYAGYLLEHGLNDLLTQPVNRTELGQFLSENNEARQQHRPEPDWVDYTAREIVARFANSS
jgi:hypothetical protein